MSKYWNQLVKELQPYVPGEQPQNKKYIKLNTNENPYPPSPKVIEAIQQTASGDLRLYPDPNCNELREKLAEYYEVEKEQIFVGNGSDEILAFAFQTFFEPGSPILFPDISYSFYKVYANLFQLHYTLVPLDEEFNIPIEPFKAKNGGIIFPNPNAPTGKGLSAQFIREILDANPEQVVIVDEAYVDFGAESMIKYVNEYPNLLVIQTFSKSRSLAGLRIGYAIGHPDLIEGLQRVKNSFNSYTLDRLAISGAVAALSDRSYYEEITNAIIHTRNDVVDKLQSLGFSVIESRSNFVFISHPEVHASLLYAKLKDAGVLVRYFNQPRIDNFLRVTIGLENEMEVFLRELKNILTK